MGARGARCARKGCPSPLTHRAEWAAGPEGGACKARPSGLLTRGPLSRSLAHGALRHGLSLSASTGAHKGGQRGRTAALRACQQGGVLQEGALRQGTNARGGLGEFLRLLQHSVAILPQSDRERMVLTQALLRNSVALLECHRSLVILVQEVPLDSHIVVGNCEHRIVVHCHLLRACSAHSLLDQIKRAQGMLHCLLVLLQLGEYCTDVKVGTSQCDLICVEVHFHFKGPSEVAQCSVQLPYLLVITSKVVASYRQQVGVVALRLVGNQNRLGIFELLEGRI
mmetsp:Transcript_81749/g.226432  ORF Transcript_81749/g.226432 Transcript_81749/m.226432 type:complete len:282 (+) Transcript_81749:2092-2937(+)